MTTPGRYPIVLGSDPRLADQSTLDARYVASTTIRHIVTLTQAAFNAITTPDAATLYVLTD